MPFKTSHAAIALSCFIQTPAFADDGAADEAGTIIVTGQVDGYRVIETTSGTKTSTPILDVPQSITVITAEQIADQQIRSITDLVRFVPGVASPCTAGQLPPVVMM